MSSPTSTPESFLSRVGMEGHDDAWLDICGEVGDHGSRPVVRLGCCSMPKYWRRGLVGGDPIDYSSKSNV